MPVHWRKLVGTMIPQRTLNTVVIAALLSLLMAFGAIWALIAIPPYQAHQLTYSRVDSKTEFPEGVTVDRA